MNAYTPIEGDTVRVTRSTHFPHLVGLTGQISEWVHGDMYRVELLGIRVTVNATDIEQAAS
jgi:hypothetical protein